MQWRKFHVFEPLSGYSPVEPQPAVSSVSPIKIIEVPVPDGTVDCVPPLVTKALKLHDIKFEEIEIRVLAHYQCEYFEAAAKGSLYAGKKCGDLAECTHYLGKQVKKVLDKNEELVPVYTNLLYALGWAPPVFDAATAQSAWSDIMMADMKKKLAEIAKEEYEKNLAGMSITNLASGIQQDEIIMSVMEKNKKQITEMILGKPKSLNLNYPHGDKVDMHATSEFVPGVKVGDTVGVSVTKTGRLKARKAIVENHQKPKQVSTVIPPPPSFGDEQKILKEAGDLPSIGGWDTKYAVWLQKSETGSELVTVCVAVVEAGEVLGALEPLYNTMPSIGWMHEHGMTFQIRDQVRESWMHLAGHVYEQVAE